MPRVILRQHLLSRDPTLVLLAFAAWAILSSVSLLGRDDVFARVPAYQALARLPITEIAWGWAMGADGLALAWASLFGGVASLTVVATLSSGMWAVIGTMMMLGANEVGMFSASGAWELLMAAGLVASVVQSGNQETAS